MIVGKVYRCTNRLCNCEVVVLKASQSEGCFNPRCCCGSEMKKPYVAPLVRELSGPEADRLRSLFNGE